MHRVVERLVHGVDVDLLGLARAEPDPLEEDARLGEPAPDVGDEILRARPLVEVSGLLDSSSGKESRGRWRSDQSRSSSPIRSRSINTHFEDTLFLGKAHDVGRLRQHVNLIDYALLVNGLTILRHERRGRLPKAA